MAAAGVAAAGVAAAALVACTGGGLDDARRRQKEIQRIDPAAAETELVAGANALRREAGLPPLAAHPNLTEKARRWSATMAGEGRLYHSLLSDGVAVPWSRLGENVGQGMAARSVHESFVASPRHHANLSDPAFTHVGVGVAPTPDGTLFVTEVFMEAAPPSAPPAPPRAGVPAPERPPPRPVPPPEALRAVDRPPPAPPPTARPPAAPRTPSAQLIHVLRQLRELEGR